MNDQEQTLTIQDSNVAFRAFVEDGEKYGLGTFYFELFRAAKLLAMEQKKHWCRRLTGYVGTWKLYHEHTPAVMSCVLTGDTVV